MKVHTVAIMKLLEADAFYGAAAQSATAETESWERYKHQKHDLFISTQEAEKRDLFLTVRVHVGRGVVVCVCVGRWVRLLWWVGA